MTNISIFGMGQVGLANAVCLARKGHYVIAIDPNSERIQTIQQGLTPFFEPKLADYLKEVIERKELFPTTDPQTNSKAEIAYITVGTPSTPDGNIDLTYVEGAARDIGRSLRNKEGYQLVIIKSTVTPGTARNIIKPLIEKESGKRSGGDFGLCSNPEFIREGHAIQDTENPDRIIIGSEDDEVIRMLEEFYRELHKPTLPKVIKTSHENAELIKYANNAFLAAKISFINTIANIAERIPNADVGTVAKGIGLDPRIATGFLEAGLGYGGSCLPKDVRALVAFSRARGYNPQLLDATTQVNHSQPFRAIEFAKQTFGSLKGTKIAILGLAFKPNTDDIREAVSIQVIEALVREGAQIFACDPAAIEAARQILGDRIQYSSDPRECLKGSDLAVVVTEWDEFRELHPEEFLALMRSPILFDGRRIYSPEGMQRAGINYAAIGLGAD